VSIVTVVRNGAATLRRAAESVLSQDYPGVEYIVIDGGSTDGTLDIIRSLEDRICAWTSGRDAGISDAFNKGIALARGETVGILNSDDWYAAGAVAAAVRELDRTGADIVCGGMQLWAGSTPSWDIRSDPLGLEHTMTIGHPTVFARRSLYERLGLFRLDFRLAMDYEWLLRAHRAGARFAVVEQCLTNMTEGGVGDRRWHFSQLEVARARAMHLRHGRVRIAADFAEALVRGVARRVADGIGLRPLRRVYRDWKRSR
jgi:glycosyltransferase involved in cell wall biosynthesis